MKGRILAAVATVALGGAVALSGPAAAAPAVHHAIVKKHKKHKKRHKKHHAATSTSATPHLGQVAKDGDFAFVVHSVQCGVTHEGTTTFGTTAPAGTSWCLVSMTVTDDKTSAQTFDPSAQKAVDTHGRQLSATTQVIPSIPSDSQAEFTQVNPGVNINVVVPFDVPNGDSIVKFVLHDSIFSNGVTVDNAS